MRVIWRRLLTNPRTRVLERDGELTRLAIDGLVCDRVCAARSKRALQRLDGVRRVDVDLDSGIATIEGRPHDAAAYERAIDSVVALRPLRRALEAFGRRFTRARQEAA